MSNRITLTKTRRAISRTVAETIGESLQFHSERMPMMRAEMTTAMLDVYRYPLASIVLNVPATWWQHLKESLRSRWPRLFGRLSVRYVPHRMNADDEYPCLPPMPQLGEPMRVLQYSKSPTWTDPVRDEADR